MQFKRIIRNLYEIKICLDISERRSTLSLNGPFKRLTVFSKIRDSAVKA